MSWQRQSCAGYLRALAKLLAAVMPLLIAPPALIRGSISPGGRLAALSAGVMVGAAALTAAYLMWNNDLWGQSDRSVRRRRGIISRSEYAIDRDSLVSLRVDDNPFTALTKSRIVRLGVRYPRRRRVAPLLLGRKDTARLVRSFLGDIPPEGHEYAACGRDIAFAAFARSDFASGLLIAAPFVLKLGRYVDPSLPWRILSDASVFASGRIGISPYVAALALIPVFGWTAHFVSNCMRFGRLRWVRRGDMLMVRQGVIGRSAHYFAASSVTALDIRRTMAMRLFGLRSCSFITRGGRYPMIPTASDQVMGRELAGIFAHSGDAVTIRPPEYARYRYSLWWCALSFAALALWLRMYLGGGFARDAAGIVLLPAAAILLWRAAVGAAAAGEAGVKLYGDCVEITGVRGMAIRELRIFRGSVDEVRITANPFMPDELCDLYIRPSGARRGQKCRYLPRGYAEMILDRLG